MTGETDQKPPIAASDEPPPEPAPDNRGAFDRLFNIGTSKNPAILDRNALDVTTQFDKPSADLVTTLKQDLDRRNVHLDLQRGPLNKDGNLSFLFQSGDDPGAVVRIGTADDPPPSAIVIKPAARFDYVASGEPDATKYQVHIMPYAPDIGQVSQADIINTLRVLKTEGFERQIGDMSPGQFVYLKNDKGGLMRYPDTLADESLRGKPIAFIRDLNSIQAGAKAAEGVSGARGAAMYMEGLGRILDAPAEYGAGNGKPVARIDTKGMTETQVDELRDTLGNSGFTLQERGGPGQPIVLEGEEAVKLRDMQTHLDDRRASLDLETLKPAPPEALAAVHQQDVLSDKIKAKMSAAGVDIAPQVQPLMHAPAAEEPKTAAGQVRTTAPKDPAVPSAEAAAGEIPAAGTRETPLTGPPRGAETSVKVPAAGPEPARFAPGAPGMGRLQAGAAGLGIVQSVVGLREAYETGDKVEGAISGVNLATSTLSTADVLLTSTARAVPVVEKAAPVIEGALPAVEGSLPLLSRAGKFVPGLNYATILADGGYRISKEDTTRHKVERGAVVGTTAAVSLTVATATATGAEGAALTGLIGAGGAAVVTVAAPVAATVAAGYAVEKTGEAVLDNKRAWDSLDQQIAESGKPEKLNVASPIAGGKPSIIQYRHIIAALMEVSPDMKDSALSTELQRDERGRMKIGQIRGYDMSDPKNLKEFERALDAKIAQDEKVVKDNSSMLPHWLRFTDSRDKEENGAMDLAPLKAARAELDMYKKELAGFDAAHPAAQSKFAGNGANRQDGQSAPPPVSPRRPPKPPGA